MPVPFLGSVLKSLSKVYSFKSGGPQAPVDFETTLPIQPVHDLSPMASLGAAVGPYDGFWILNVQLTHVAVGQLLTTPFITAPTVSDHGFPPGPNSYDPDKDQVWVYDQWAHTDDTTDFQYLTLAIANSWYGVGCRSGAATVMIPRCTLHTATSRPAAAGGFIFAGDVAGEYENVVWPLPMLRSVGTGLLDDPHFTVYSSADNLGTETVSTFFLFWLGPKGVPPPKMG